MLSESTYWQRRKGWYYYRAALSMVRALTPAPKTLLDVGGGVTMGAKYLEWIPELERTSVERRMGARQLDGVRVIHSEFEGWQPDKEYDAVLCLQVLEHVADPMEFAKKLFMCANRLVVISIPYMWKGTGKDTYHIHNELCELSLYGWTGMVPAQKVIVEDTPKHGRLVAGYVL